MTGALIFIGFALLFAFRGVGRDGWSLLILLYLLFLSQIQQASMVTLVIVGLPAALLLLLANHNGTRQRVLITPLHRLFKGALPEISATEQDAIDAGTVSWDGQLFAPRPDWDQLLSYPPPRLTEEEQAFIDGPTEQLCRMLDDWKINHDSQDLPRDVWRFMKQQRFLGMIIDTAHGGLGFSALAHSTVVMKLSTRSVSAAVTVMVPNSLGPAELLHLYGTEEQRNHYLPRLAKGTEIPCFALTSPPAGSDAGAITDSGVLCMGRWKNREVLGFRLNWNKRYITLAPVATLIGLAFKAYDPDHLLGEEESLGITCALVPAKTAGVVTGARHRPMNCVFMNGPTQGKDVFIPLEQVIGGREFIGRGWSMLMNCLSVGRAVSLPALSTGAGKLACLTSGAYAHIREQFNTPIGQFEGVADALAPIAGLTYMMDSARCFTVNLVDCGEKPSVPSAILKYHNTEAMRRVVNHAMDIHGGRAIMEGPRNYLARLYQAIPISITVEGANILTRSMMIFGQGAIRCHPYLLAEMQAVGDTNTQRGKAALDQLLGQHLKRNLQAAARTLLLGLSAGRLAAPAAEHAHSRRYLQRMEQLGAAFVLLADLALALLGAKLKTKESLSARLGDCLSYLYLGSAIIKRFHDQGCRAGDLPLMQWSMDHCLYQLQQALSGLLDNLPYPRLAGLLRLWVFPLGRPLQPPSDALNQRLAALLMQPSTVRDGLVDGVFCNLTVSDPVGRVECAFQLKTACAASRQRIAEAQRSGALPRGPFSAKVLADATKSGIITPGQCQEIERMQQAVDDAIAVDDYRVKPTAPTAAKRPTKTTRNTITAE